MADYRMEHQPSEEGAPLHDLTRIYPADVYTNPDRYDVDEPDVSGQTLDAIKRYRGRPDDLVTVYRAVPHGVTEINPGDWVTTSLAYAERHGMHHDDPSQDWPVISREVPVREVRNDGNSLHEYGWFPAKDPGH